MIVVLTGLLPIMNFSFYSTIAQLTSRLNQPWLKKLALAYLAFCVLTGVVAQPLLNHYLGAIYKEQTGRIVTYDLVNFNPLSLNLSVTRAADHNPDGSVFWKVDRIDLNLAFWASIVRAAPGMDAVAIKGLVANITRDKQGTFNFSDILDHQSALAATNAESETTPEIKTAGDLPRFFIGKTRLYLKSIRYTEQRAEKDFTQSIDDFLFRLDDLSTISENGQEYAFRARLDQLGTTRWRGELSLKSEFSQGEFSLTDIPLSPISDYLSESLNLTIDNGKLSLAGKYSVDWSQSLKWSLQDLHTQIHQLTINGKTPGDLTLSLHHLDVLANDLNDEQVVVEKVIVDGLNLKSWSQGGELGLTNALVLTEVAATTDEPNQESNAVDEEASPFDYHIKHLALNNSRVDWTLKDFNALALSLNDIRVTAKDLNPNGRPSEFTLHTQIIDQAATGKIALDGQVNIANLDGSVNLHLVQLPLQLVNPIVQDFVNGQLTSGSLNAQASITLTNGEPTFASSHGALNNFLLVPHDTQEEAVSFAALSWQDTQVHLQQHAIDAGHLAIQNLDGRFIITQQGTTNLDALLNTHNNDDVVKTDATNTTDEKPWAITLQSVTLDNASFRFHDESLTPNFTAAIQNFSGQMQKLSSEDSTPAAFNFAGNVDGYAPVTLKGQAQPFLADPHVQAALTFKHLDLGGLSTYSSTYAGWRIERGQLSANLNYHLEQGRILGDNHVEMDKLQLGERVRSAQAMDIPLRLALAMITDTQGRAVLDVAVSGDVNEPSFHIGKLIRDALINSITKLVTSPFRMLAGLVNSDEDLGVLPFNSGSQKILATANRRLNNLKEALEKRPALRIQLIGRVDPISDTRGLQILQANEVLGAQGLSRDDIKQKNKRWETAVSKHYRNLKIDSDKDLTIDEQYEGWLASFDVAPEALEQLALERSTNAKLHLVNQLGVDASRVFINANTECKEEDPTECRRRIVKIDLTDNWDLPSFSFSH